MICVYVYSLENVIRYIMTHRWRIILLSTSFFSFHPERHSPPHASFKCKSNFPFRNWTHILVSIAFNGLKYVFLNANSESALGLCVRTRACVYVWMRARARVCVFVFMCWRMYACTLFFQRQHEFASHSVVKNLPVYFVYHQKDEK